MMQPYIPTIEQKAVIEHAGSTFVSACPGAGKTRTLVERARLLLARVEDRRGVAFLSFTNAAVDELESRLRTFGVLPYPVFPNFIGTFDRFLWQFLIAPFGIPGCSVIPRLVPNKSEWEIKPFDAAQPLPFKCFNRSTGAVIPAAARRLGFDVADRPIEKYEATVRKLIERSREIGRIDFDDVRACARERIEDKPFAARVGTALGARFKEVIVDEAQDCNPADLEMVDWLRRSGITVKIICDPQQSIYEFRGGVTDELLKFKETFPVGDRLTLSGNFRSSPAICSAIVAFRPSDARDNPDEAVGRHKNDNTPVHLLSYAGNGVSPDIGPAFAKLVASRDLPLTHAPVVASTDSSACKAAGQAWVDESNHPTLCLALATMGYHDAFATGNRREALGGLHSAVLLVHGRIPNRGAYNGYLEKEGLEDGHWRADIIKLAGQLRLGEGEAPDDWLKRAKTLLLPGLTQGENINVRLRAHQDLPKALKKPLAIGLRARTIHSVKGLEFPAVCVVMTSTKAGSILDLLEGAADNGEGENARKLYVGASRAERLLVFAVPKNSAERLGALLRKCGCSVEIHNIEKSLSAGNSEKPKKARQS